MTKRHAGLLDFALPLLLRPRAGEILAATAAHYGFTELQLVGPDRHREFARPRQLAMALTRTLTDLRLSRIGHHFGGRDRTTVAHACVAIEQLLGQDDDLANAAIAIAAALVPLVCRRNEAVRRAERDLRQRFVGAGEGRAPADQLVAAATAYRAALRANVEHLF